MSDESTEAAADLSQIGRKRPGKRLIFIAVLLLAAAGIWLIANPRTESAPKNIVIVFVDTLNRSALGAYSPDAPSLPGLDSFAREAAVFERAYSTASWTLPAYASLLTGLFPDRHGVVHVDRRLDDDTPTLATLLREAGYETVAFTDEGFTTAAYGFDRDFNRYNTVLDAEPAGPDSIPRNGKRTQVAGEKLFDRGIAYLRGRTGGDEDDPGFFLLLHTYTVHDYFRAHPWALERIPPPVSVKPFAHYVKCIAGIRPCPEEDWAYLRDLYRAELHHLDEGFERLLDTLEKTGLRDSTLVVLLSDHGEGFDPARGRIHHGGRLHEDLVRIPLMVAGPGVTAHRATGPVSIADVMPTLVDLLGLDPPADLDGVSFAPALRGHETPSTRPLFASEYFHYWRRGGRRDMETVPQEPLSVAVIRGDDWYIRSGDAEELYDMAADPQQRNDLSETSSKTVELRAKAGSRIYALPQALPFVRSEELNEHLRSLGYLN